MLLPDKSHVEVSSTLVLWFDGLGDWVNFNPNNGHVLMSWDKYLQFLTTFYIFVVASWQLLIRETLSAMQYFHPHPDKFLLL
jgi:hypothetical protein